MDTSTRVSVVIPTLNGRDLLIECLSSLTRQNVDGVEVIVVDNGSTDGTAEALADRPNVSVIRNATNTGFAPACNRGASVARGRYLLFLNNDARLEDTALAQLLAEADADPRAAIWQPLVETTNGDVESAGHLVTRTGLLWHLREPFQASAYSVFAVGGACVLVRRSAFETLGGFDGAYFAYFDESDLCWRARLTGSEVMVVPSARTVHLRSVTTRRVLPPSVAHYLGYRNRLRSILTNASPATLLWMLPKHLAACLVAAAAFLTSGRPRAALAVLSAITWPLVNHRAVKQRRREVQAKRVLADRDVFRGDLVVRLGPRRALELLRGNVGRW